MTNIDFSKSEQYILSIRLSADGFSFSIHHPQKMEYFFFTTYQVNTSYSLTANIKEMIVSTDILKHSYRQVNILINTNRVTPIPFDLFEDESSETLFYHNFSKIDNEIVLCNVLGKSNIALLFGMDKYAHQLLIEQFPKARIFASISPIIEHFVLKSKEESSRNLYVHFLKEKMEVFAFDKGKLLFINSFNCKVIADQVYYILYVWQQLGFSQERDQLGLVGTMEHEDELLTELGKFLRKVTLLPQKQFIPYDIQTLMICE